MVVGRQLRLCTSHCSTRYRPRDAACPLLEQELGALTRSYDTRFKRRKSRIGGSRAWPPDVHSAGQGILGRRVDEVKCLVKVFVFVHVDLLYPVRQRADGRED